MTATTPTIRLKSKQIRFVRACMDDENIMKLRTRVDGRSVILLQRADIKRVVDANKLPYPQWFTTNSEGAFRVADPANPQKYKYGIFNIGDLVDYVETLPDHAGIATEKKAKNPETKKAVFGELPKFSPGAFPEQKENPEMAGTHGPAWELATKVSFVPTKLATFIPFGIYNDVEQVIKSGLFYPVFITGLSGNGKTESILQACSHLDREAFLVSITSETDEDDLLGGFRLIAGETKWQDGPVIEAMRRGAVLILDEIDYGSSKLSCMQGVLSGKGVLLKKTGVFVSPAPGFNVIATANTKGKGDDNGKFVGTNVLNEAFLDRFPATFEQVYPTKAIEKKILAKVAKSLAIEDDDYIELLVQWAEGTRKSYADGALDEVITTRRLIQIMNAYAIFKDRRKSIEVATARFDDATKGALMDYYKAIDAKASGAPDTTTVKQETGFPDEIPYS